MSNYRRLFVHMLIAFSSEIEKLIGYVESEHVVDSITFL